MMMLDPKALDAARELPGTNHEAIIREYLSTITPAEIGGLVDAQTEARALADDLLKRAANETIVHHWHAKAAEAIATALSERDATIAELERQRTHWMGEARRTLKAGQDALDRADRMGREGWQPIETAPVNGPDFVAWVIDIIDEYDEDDRLVVRGKKVGRAVIAQCVSFTGDDRGEVVEIPWKFVQGRQYTHWMPLPAAPATRTGGPHG